MTKNIKPVESLTVADFKAHPVWEYLNDHDIGYEMVEPVGELPVENLVNRLVGSQVRLANGSLVWALIGNFNVTNLRATQHWMTLSIYRGDEWRYLSRYHDMEFPAGGPEDIARFLGQHVDDVFPISVDVRRYVRGDPASLKVILPKEPHEKLTEKERWTLG